MFHNPTGKEPHYRGSFFIHAKSDMADMFRTVYVKYDFFNHLFSVGNDIRWRKRSVKFLQFRNNDTILDYGAGTGDFAFAVRETANVKIIALDLVKEMLDRFKSKLTRRGSVGVTLIMGDGEDLPFSGNNFDGVVAGFAGRNLFDLEKGIREIHRVLKPGGRVGFLEFCSPLNPFVRLAVWIYFRIIIAFLGNLFMPKDVPAYSYLIESVEGFHTGNELKNMFKTNGFKNVCLFGFNLGTVLLLIGEK